MRPMLEHEHIRKNFRMYVTISDETEHNVLTIDYKLKVLSTTFKLLKQSELPSQRTTVTTNILLRWTQITC